MTSTSGGRRPSVVRRRGACDACKARKVRCDGDRPCTQCRRLGRECIYRPRRRDPTVQQASISEAGWETALASPASTSAFPFQDLEEQQDQSSRQDPPVNCLAGPASLQGMSFADYTADLWSSTLSPLIGLCDTSDLSCLDSANLVVDGGNQRLSTSNASAIVGLSDPPDGGQGESQVRPSTSSLPKPLSPTVWPKPMFGITLPHESERCNAAVVAERSLFPPHVETRPFCVASAFSFAQLEVPAALQTSEMSGAVNSFAKLTPQEQDLSTDDHAQNTRFLLDDREMVEELIAASCRDPLGLSLFIDFGELKYTALSEFNAGSCSPVVKSLVYATLAIGIHLRSTESRPDTKSSEPLFQKAFGELGNVLVAKDALLKLQALVTMVHRSNLTYARLLNLSCLRALMNNAMWCCQNLQMFNDTIKHDHVWLKRTMAYLAVQAQTYSFRWGIEQSWDHECMKFGVPRHPRDGIDRTYGDTDHLSMQLEYVGILVRVRGALDGREKGSSLATETEDILSQLREQLDTWIQKLPPGLWDRNLPPERSDQRRMYLHLSMQYYELLLALDSKCLSWAGPTSGKANYQLPQAYSRCARTARSILKHCEGLRASDVHSNRALILPLLLAIRFTFLSAISAHTDGKDAPYLAIACGLFGKLSMGLNVPLAEVIDLNQVVQKLFPASISLMEQT